MSFVLKQEGPAIINSAVVFRKTGK